MSHDLDGLGGVEPVIFAKTQAGLDYVSADNFLII
jgi:hypothetical protein